MTVTSDAVVLHQLLGRVVYFHELFVAPVLRPVSSVLSGLLCCNHGNHPGRRTRYGLLAATAWTALDEVAAELVGYDAACPELSQGCCATCRVADCAAAIADAWLNTELCAYARPAPSTGVRRAVRAAAAQRLSGAFADQHQAHCPGQAGLNPADEDPLSESGELPLSAELLALWQQPVGFADQPVISWLNHCTALTDIHRVLTSRRAS